jgi:hypothetical protein
MGTMERKSRYGKDRKTTVELPEQMLRDAKATAASRGTSLKDYVQEALAEKLARRPSAPSKKRSGWPVEPMPMTPEERRLFDEAVVEFEEIDPDDWR